MGADLRAVNVTEGILEEDVGRVAGILVAEYLLAFADAGEVTDAAEDDVEPRGDGQVLAPVEAVDDEGIGRGAQGLAVAGVGVANLDVGIKEQVVRVDI